MKLLVGGRYRYISVKRWLKKHECEEIHIMEEVLPGNYVWYLYSRNSEYFNLIYQVKYPYQLYIFQNDPGEVFSPHVFYYYLQTGEVVDVAADLHDAIKLGKLEYGNKIELGAASDK